MRKFLTVLLISACASVAPAYADETPTLQPSTTLTENAAQLSAAVLPALAAVPLELETSPSLMSRAVDSVQSTLDQAMDYLGIRYRRGGSTAESGFDCSGYVRKVFADSLGLVLPHNAKAISQTSAKVDKSELQPGDLVFFNTMRRAFSHVGIYLGNDQFVHAPRAGSKVRIEDMTDRYWSRRFNGARRVQQ